jgi:hypothetical protein
MGISRDYPLKTRTSKQPTGEIPGCELIPSHPLKYPRSKQGLHVSSLQFLQNGFLEHSFCFVHAVSSNFG